MQYDVIIAGGGMVGAALAALLGKAGRQVAVLETAWPTVFAKDSNYDLRVSAISRASQALLERVGAWERIIAMRAARYEAMKVWDATGNGSIGFDAADLGEPDLGHIIENRVIQQALLQTLEDWPSVTLFCPARLQAFEKTAQQVTVTLDNGTELQAALLVGADGAHSQVRELAGITWRVDDYAQKGVVAVVQTALPHQRTAWQRFMPTGPLAFLPLLDEYHCSIVWTLPSDRADMALSWDETRFKRELAQALDYRLGEIVQVSERAAFPLKGRHAHDYVKERLALIGDAAHTIHPLAGQGVNLGFKDAAALADVLGKATDPGHLRLLRAYERSRRGDNLATQKAMEAFRLLFGNTLPLWQGLRNTGLSVFDRLDPIKAQVARRAMGL